jgi:hypothetical protein
MITPNQIGWGKYKTREGPMFGGSRKLVLSENPSDNEKYIAVLTATEGGYNAINMYDSCIISVGLIQVCEAFFMVSNMLGDVAEKLGTDAVLVPLKPALDAAGATFRKNPAGKWRFAFNDDRGEVTAGAMQRDLFLSCSGNIGDWTPASRSYAKLWAASVANVFDTEEACAAQLEFLAKRIRTYVLPDAAKIIFDGENDDGWRGALRAGFVSFSANRPSTAQTQLKSFVANTTEEKWSPNWCIGILKSLTFGPSIDIYPVRYNQIAPLLKKLWGVDLPLTSDELKNWVPTSPVSVPQEPQQEPQPNTPVPPPVVEQPTSTPETHSEPKNNDLVIPQPTNTGTQVTVPRAERSTFDWIKLVFEFISRLFKMLTEAGKK